SCPVKFPLRSSINLSDFDTVPAEEYAVNAVEFIFTVNVFAFGTVKTTAMSPFISVIPTTLDIVTVSPTASPCDADVIEADEA
ncbi:hypothetical protein M3M33_16040, partial [Loigolactobacillus coryniformis]